MEEKKKKIIKKIVLTIIISIICMVLVFGGGYLVLKWIAERVTKAASAFFSDIKISGRQFSTGMSAEELWNMMKAKGYEVDKYLDSPEELKKLLEAELVTQLPDTREDVTKPIDWDAIINEKDKNNKSKDKTDTSGNINVLFVGNSKTYVNELPTQFQQLAQSLGKEVYAVRTYEQWGGRTLNAFLDEDGPAQDFKQRVSEKKWDYVVLQEQTDASLNSTQLTQGATRVINYIKENSNPDVIPVYAAWSVVSDFNESQYNQAIQCCETAQSQTGGKVAYIARVLLECHSKYPSIELFYDDRHPTHAGTYLAACCIFRAIYGEKTEGATFTLGLPTDTATNIQKITDEVQTYSSASSSNVQGIIKFKRHDENGNEYYLTYVEPEEFYNAVDSFNGTNSNEGIDYVKRHFTLKKSPTASSTVASNTNTNTGSTNDSTEDISKKIVEAAKNTPSPGESLCLMWVDNVYDNAGVTPNRTDTAYLAWLANGVSTDKNNIPVGAAVYGTGSGNTQYEGKGAGHVGIYMGDGKVRENVGFIREITLDEWIEKNVDVIDGKQGWLGWGWEDGNKTRGTSETTKNTTSTSDNNSSDKNKDKKDTSKKDSKNKKNTTSANFTGQIDTSKGGDGWYGTYTSHNGITYKDYKQGSPAPWSGHGGNYGSSIGSVGCAPTSLAIILSGTVNDSITPVETFDKLGEANFTWLNATEAVLHGFGLYGMQAEKITNPTSQQILDFLKQGKVMVASLDASIFYEGPHAVAIVDVNTDTGEVFVMDPAGLTNSQWVSASYIESKDRYIVVADAGKGGISGGVSSNTSITSITPGYQAVVATVKEVNKSTEFNGTNAEAAAEGLGIGIENGTSYLVSTTTVNYEELVRPYTLSFDLLWSFLVIGQSKGFVMDWADLAYNSQIEVSVFDNQITITDMDFWRYTDAIFLKIKGELKYIDEKDKKIYKENVSHEHTDVMDEPVEEDEGTIRKKIVTNNTQAKAALTKAHTWIMNYDVGYTRNKDDGTFQMSQVTMDDQKVTEYEKNEVGIEEDKCGKIEETKEKMAKEINEKYKNKNITAKNIDDKDVKVFKKKERIKIKDTTGDRTATSTYVQGVASIEIKDEDIHKKKEKKKTSDDKPQETKIENMDNFLFIGDSRYDSLEDINQLGNNVTNLGVGSARIDEWRDVAQNGGSGTVQGRAVDVTGSYSGISIQLGANSLWMGANKAASQMKELIDGLKKIHPGTAIIVNSCLPDTDYSQADINAFNNEVRDYCNSTENVYYIDISNGLVDSSGYIKSEYTQDGCHLSSSEATRIFAENIKNGALGKSSSLASSVDEENFVSLFNKAKYRQNKNNILSATQWLFEILQKNDKTKNMVDVIKYLLYKATNTNYGVTEFPTDLFDPSKYQNVQSGSSGSGVTNDLISFIEAMEGEGEKSGEDYVVYYTSFDGCLNVGAGVVVKFKDGSTRFTEVIGEPYVGQIVTKAQYQQMFNQEFKEITDVLDAELAQQGVTLKSHQRDAMISFLYNVGTGYTSKIVTAYKNGGDEGYWNETKDCVHSVTGEYLLGLQRRREQEYKLFTTGVYEWPY